MKFSLRKEMSGQIQSIHDDPYDSRSHALLKVTVGGEQRRLMVTQRFLQENDFLPGDEVTWNKWIFPFLNFLTLNPVQDVTNLFPQEKNVR